MSERVSTRVKRGARLLDKKLGPGWRRKIRRRDLNLAASTYEGRGSCGCILAQLAPDGSYNTGLEILGISYFQREDRRYGFEREDEDYTELTAEWLKELRR